MKRRLILASIALVMALCLTLLQIRNRKKNAAPLTHRAPQIERSAPPPKAQEKTAARRPKPKENLSSARVRNDIENMLPARLSIEDLQSTREGYEAALYLDQIPIREARVYVTQTGAKMALKIIPLLPNPITAHTHQKINGLAAENKAQQDAAAMSACEIFSIGQYQLIWWASEIAGVVPAYSVEAHYRCEGNRKREDWVYRDPDLEKIASLKKRL